jgi:hypothetical protein
MAIPIGHSLFGLAWAAYPIVVRQHRVAMISYPAPRASLTSGVGVLMVSQLI